MSLTSPYAAIAATIEPCCKAANQSSRVWDATSGRCSCEHKDTRKGMVRYNPKNSGPLTLIKRGQRR